MRFLPIFVGLLLLTSAAMGASAPLNKDVVTPIKSDTSTANRIGWVSIQTIPAAETSDDDQLTTATPANNTTHILLVTAQFLAQPDVPRNIIVTPSGSVTGSLKITGTDIAGSSITENLTLNGAGVVASTKAFKNVTRIDGTFTQETARSLKIGTGDLLGLNSKLATNTILLAALDDTREGTAPSITVNSTVLSLNTIDTNTAPGGKITKVWYIV